MPTARVKTPSEVEQRKMVNLFNANFSKHNVYGDRIYVDEPACGEDFRPDTSEIQERLKWWIGMFSPALVYNQYKKDYHRDFIDDTFLNEDNKEISTVTEISDDFLLPTTEMKGDYWSTLDQLVDTIDQSGGTIFGGFVRDYLFHRHDRDYFEILAGLPRGERLKEKLFNDIDIWFYDKHHLTKMISSIIEMGLTFDIDSSYILTNSPPYQGKRSKYNICHHLNRDVVLFTLDVVISDEFPVVDFDFNCLVWRDGEMDIENPASHEGYPLEIDEVLERLHCNTGRILDLIPEDDFNNREQQLVHRYAEISHRFPGLVIEYRMKCIDGVIREGSLQNGIFQLFKPNTKSAVL